MSTNKQLNFGITSTSIVQETAAADIVCFTSSRNCKYFGKQKLDHNESGNSLDIKDSDFTLFLEV